VFEQVVEHSPISFLVGEREVSYK